MIAREMRRFGELERMAGGIKKTRAKATAKYRNRKKLVWTGRGSMPRWIRDERKLLKLKPDAF
ncbi:H-NS family nucleoid-associated regulatory protein [Bradyrhizobium sp. P5_C12]